MFGICAMSHFNLPSLNALRVFEAAARLGSFKAAADELCVTPSAVSHQIANLEASLDVPLFHREGRKLQLNDAGDAYRHRIHDALMQLALATDEVIAGATAPALTVIAAPSFASKWLMPRLDDFLGDRPELRVRVEATTDQRHLGTADVGIFYGVPREPGLIVRPFIAERMLVLCSPALLESGPPLQVPSDLAGHVLIDARNRLRWRNWLAGRGLENLTIRREMAVGRSTMAIEAAVNGLGVILESDFLAAEEIA
ncbi:MAG: LysR substrate-binding domain-containing protein, partial [Pirellulales bacterium]|nr:LysR substrate-binding domain-containing protein [Pirellulales bacterium]